VVVVGRAVHLALPEGGEAGTGPVRPWRLWIEIVVPVDEPIVEVDAG